MEDGKIDIQNSVTLKLSQTEYEHGTFIVGSKRWCDGMCMWRNPYIEYDSSSFLSIKDQSNACTKPLHSVKSKAKMKLKPKSSESFCMT